MARQRSLPKRRSSKAKTLKEQKQVGGYQFKITLLGTQPLVWRRFQVPECTLGELHHVIQMVMGWEEAHLHQFIVGKQYYGMVEGDMSDMGLEMLDETCFKLRDLIPPTVRSWRAVYEYDFGDSWEHELVLEKRLAAAEFPGNPLCLEGAGACPPEDCGGVWGYSELLEACKNKGPKADPDDESYDERLDWLGDDFDPAEFSLKEVNQTLKKRYL
jgi:hypothetical protein